jgi:hypothetical protein
MADRDAERRDDGPLGLERETDRLAELVKRTRSEVRALQWLIAGVAIMGSGTLFYLHEAGIIKLRGMRGEPEKTVESQEFGLYNRKGDRVMLVDYDKFGYPNLVFMDLAKTYKMGVKVWPEGGGTPGMVFYDDRGGTRGNWRMDEKGSTVLNLMGSKGTKGRISLAVTPEGDPHLTVVDRDGKVLLEVPERGGQAPYGSVPPQALRNAGHALRPRQ